MAIVKEAKEAPGGGRRAEAGRRAERQMAHYLRRAFTDRPGVRVFNDLRLERDGEFAQIDHLLLHKHGFVIIESKSVHDAVAVDQHGEWRRRVRGRWQGMPSPIEQARRQGELLRALLNDHAETLLTKVLGVLQSRFGLCPMDLIVAVSDEGTIERKGKGPSEVVNADQAPGAARDIMRRHAKASRLLTKADGAWGMYTFKSGELDRLKSFLLDRHTPKSGAAEPVVTKPEGRRFVLTCRNCGASDLHARSGRYGYYAKCAACDGNTPIPLECDVCGQRGRVRKNGEEFLRVCADCGIEELVWINRPESLTPRRESR